MQRAIRSIARFWVVPLLLVVVACEEDQSDPTIDFIAEYTGTWDVIENTGINAPQVYEVQITRGSGDNEIVINGLYNISNTAVTASINEFSLTIPNQQSESIHFEGSGEANADFDQITLNFTADDGSGDDEVEAVLTQ